MTNTNFDELLNQAKLDKQHLPPLLSYYQSLAEQGVEQTFEEETDAVRELYDQYGWCPEMIDLIVFCCTIDPSDNSFNGSDWLHTIFNDQTDLFEPYLGEEESNFLLFEPYLGEFLIKYFTHLIGEKNIHWASYDQDYYEDWHTGVLELIFPLEDGEELLQNLMTILADEQLPTTELLLKEENKY